MVAPAITRDASRRGSRQSSAEAATPARLVSEDLSRSSRQMGNGGRRVRAADTASDRFQEDVFELHALADEPD